MACVYSEERNADKEDFLEYALEHQFGDIHVSIDAPSGMKAIVAIHNTKLGPALGGCRFIPYPHANLALLDAMRLARGMSFKSALAGLPLGGGKAVIIKPQGPFDRKAYFHAFGKFVNSLQGRYITALDSGTELPDMDIIAAETPYVASLSRDDGDPSVATSLGIFCGIQAAVRFQKNQSNLKNITVAIQGLGHVGYRLAGLLHNAGAKLIAADSNPERAEQAKTAFGAVIVDITAIHKVPCDVYAPCALGACINDETIQDLQTSIIAGAANNQLAHRRHGQLLHDKGILYAPDYVINAGGVIFACGKYHHTPVAAVTQTIDRIAESLTTIFERAKAQNQATSIIADAMAEEILSS